MLVPPSCGAGAKTESVFQIDFSLSEATFIVGYSHGSMSAQDYEPISLICHLGYNLKRIFSGLQNHRGMLSGFLEPQINPVFKPRTDVEFGIGFGLKYMHPLTESLSGYVMVSLGPHYITIQNPDQNNGFIFCDTAGAGFAFFLTSKTAVNLEYRFRHMSNAGIKKPNNGVNTHMLAIGYTVFF